MPIADTPDTPDTTGQWARAHIIVATIAAVTATSVAPCADTFSPWDGNNAPPEVPEVQECLAGPCRKVWEVTAVAPWGRKGKLTVLGSKGPTFFLLYFFLL